MPMDYTVDLQDGVRIVRLRGPTDVSQALELRELLGKEIDGPAARVLLDLSQVTLVDSSGVGVFVAAHRRAAGAGSSFALAGATGVVGKVFELTRTNRLLRIFPTVEEGLEALRAG
jgi:anti-anti-sigma factor